MTKGRKLICGLVAVCAFAALATPAMARKEFKREFTASSAAVKLGVSGSGAQVFVFPFEEGGDFKVTCTEATGSGEILATEGAAKAFTAKLKYGGCTTKGVKGSQVGVVISPVEWEFEANGLAVLKNEVSVALAPQCTIVMSPQTVGLEAFEEGKKTPDTYAQLTDAEGLPEVEVKTKTHVHEEGEAGGLEFSGEGSECEEDEFKSDGGKLSGNLIVSAKKAGTWIGFHEAPITVLLQLNEAGKAAANEAPAQIALELDGCALVASGHLAGNPAKEVTVDGGPGVQRSCAEGSSISGTLTSVTLTQKGQLKVQASVTVANSASACEYSFTRFKASAFKIPGPALFEGTAAGVLSKTSPKTCEKKLAGKWVMELTNAASERFETELIRV